MRFIHGRLRLVDGGRCLALAAAGCVLAGVLGVVDAYAIPDLNGGKGDIEKAAKDAPDVDAPEVDVPEVDVPKVEAPQVDTGQVDSPDVGVPQVPVPAAPAPAAVPTPKIHPPPVPTAGALPTVGSSPSAPASSRVPSGGGAGTPAVIGADGRGGRTGGGRSSSRSASRGWVGASGLPVLALRLDPPGATSRQLAASRARAAYETRMRRTVEHLQGCLGTLPVDERRVLLLRANLMGAVPRSRGSVAARLRIPPDRVAGLEQRGLAHLELVSAISGCANQAGSAMAFGGVSAIDFRGAGPTSGPFAPSLRSQPTPPRSQEPAQEVAGATAHGASVAATAFIPARAFPFPAALAGVAALVLSAALVFFLLGPPHRRRLSRVETGMAPNDDARRVAETTRPPDGHAPDDVSGGAPENPTRADEPPGESGGRSPEPAVEPAMPSGNVPFPADAPPEPDRGREPVTTEHRARSHRVRSGLGMAVGAMVMAGLRRWRRRTR